MSPASDWFDEIMLGDPLHEDADEPAQEAGRQAAVTDGFDDLFVDFDGDGEVALDGEEDDLPMAFSAGPPPARAVPPPEPRRTDAPATPAEPPAPSPGAPEDAAYAGEGWAATEEQAPQDAPWECDIDTSLVPRAEMTGIWLTTEAHRESPLRLDGQPAEPEDLRLPADIADRLRDWSDQWRAEWSDAAGWSPRARIGDYEALGHFLARRVKDHVGAVDVTLQLAPLGRAGVERIAPSARRDAIVVRLANDYGRRFPVVGDFVTDSGVGSFSAELNAKLEGWAGHFADHMDPVLGWDDRRAARDHAAFAGELAADMADELGPDYRVELDLWEVGGVLDVEGPRR